MSHDSQTGPEQSRAPRSEMISDYRKHADDATLRSTVQATIDGIEIDVPFGTTILDAARKIGVTIPTLCQHDNLCIAGVCRICVVEVDGERTLHASCSYPITKSINIKTHTQKIRQARRHILELMLSEHVGECYACCRNSHCELQKLASDYGVDFYRFGHRTEERYGRDGSSPSLVRDMDKCILCRRCVRACIDLQEVGVYHVFDRGYETRVSTFMDLPMWEAICINCGQCINHCPTGALHSKDMSDDVWDAIDDPTKHVVIQTAPAPRAAIGECFGLEPGTPVTSQLNTAIRHCGFDRVFDTNFAADLTIIEEGAELLQRLYRVLVKGEDIPLPLFTSCSPGWVKYLEYFYPEMIPHLSSAKSPQQMFGSVIKTYYAELNDIDPFDIVTVSLMPCTAKKFECNRPEFRDSGYKDIDYVLTTREMAQMIMEVGVNLPDMPESDFDDPFGTATGSGVIFAATGGVMESAIRTVYELVTGESVGKIFDNLRIEPVRGFEGIRYAELEIPAVVEVPDLLAEILPDFNWLAGKTLKVAVVHGTANAKRVLENIQSGGEFADCHFIEFMACSGGCLGGGGQPIPTSRAILEARARGIYQEDEDSEVRESFENPAVVKLYHDFLTEGPLGQKSHELLHTSYTVRTRMMV
ncbi:NADH-dependent [FeFe] hydrogenase, group A6 [Gemmatimonadota bacterium]